MRMFPKIIIIPIGLTMFFVLGCSHPSLTIHDYGGKEIVVVFLDQVDSYDYIQKSEFADGMNRLNISLRLDEDLPEDDRDTELTEYNKFIFENLKDWCGYEKSIMWGASEEVIDELSTFAPTILPDTLYFINTSLRLEFNAFFTVNKAICVPSLVVWPIVFKGMIKDFIAHEMFHIYSRNNKSKRDSLYELFSFYHADTVDTRELLKSKMIRNPDVHSNNYVLRLIDSTGAVKNLLLVVQLDEKDYNDNRGITSFLGATNIFGFFDPYLYELDPYANNSFVVRNKQNPISLEWKKYQNQLDSMYGCLTDERAFAEEIAAETFMSCLMADEDPELLEDYNSHEREIIKKFLRIIREQ